MDTSYHVNKEANGNSLHFAAHQCHIVLQHILFRSLQRITSFVHTIVLCMYAWTNLQSLVRRAVCGLVRRELLERLEAVHRGQVSGALATAAAARLWALTGNGRAVLLAEVRPHWRAAIETKSAAAAADQAPPAAGGGGRSGRRGGGNSSTEQLGVHGGGSRAHISMVKAAEPQHKDAFRILHCIDAGEGSA
jgi:hypothetical protein